MCDTTVYVYAGISHSLILQAQRGILYQNCQLGLTTLSLGLYLLILLMLFQIQKKVVLK